VYVLAGISNRADNNRGAHLPASALDRASSGAATGDVALVRLVARSRARHRHALPAEARRALPSRAPRLSWCVALIGRCTPVDGRSLVDAFLTHSAPTTDARVAERVRVRQTVGYCIRRVTVCARRFGARSEALEQTIALLLTCAKQSSTSSPSITSSSPSAACRCGVYYRHLCKLNHADVCARVPAAPPGRHRALVGASTHDAAHSTLAIGILRRT